MRFLAHVTRLRNAQNECIARALGTHAVFSFRVIVVEDGNRTTQIVVPFERVPYECDVVELPDGMQVKIRHVISAAREGLAGIVLSWPG